VLLPPLSAVYKLLPSDLENDPYIDNLILGKSYWVMFFFFFNKTNIIISRITHQIGGLELGGNEE